MRCPRPPRLRWRRCARRQPPASLKRHSRSIAVQRYFVGERMQIGVFYFPADYGNNIVELARALEERGFESLFVPEHTHIPVSRRSPFPSGGELPKRYSHTHDPFVALSFAAAATKTLKLGTGIALVTQRDPIVTAKCVASLDLLSGGRFIFGVGGGWNREEMENHGTVYDTRFKL